MKPQFTVSYNPYEHERQKITNRKLKSSSRICQENGQQEYAQQVQKREEQEMLQRMYGTAEQKRALAEKEYQEQLYLQRCREQQKAYEREQERQLELKIIEQQKYQQMLDFEKKQAEREYQQYLAYQMEQQAKMSRENKLYQKKLEEEQDREILMDDFFSRHFQKSIR